MSYEQDQSIIYYNTFYLNVKNGGVSTWQGSRAINEDIFLLCGTTEPGPQDGEGVIYSGNISFTEGSLYYLNVPNALYTSIYGPNYDSVTGIFNFVGSYINKSSTNVKGFVYTGILHDSSLKNKKNYSYPSVNKLYDIVFVHSVSNGYCVGNAGNSNNDNTIAFLYSLNNIGESIKINYPGSNTTTAYGIWYNSDLDNYTIVGGFTPEHLPINRIYLNGNPLPIGQTFIVDYDSKTNEFTNWTTLNLPLDRTVLSHIQGISGYFDVPGVYTLSIDTINNDRNFGYYAVIRREKDLFTTNFVVTRFVEIKFENDGLNSINSVANNNIVGFFKSPKDSKTFQAKILY